MKKLFGCSGSGLIDSAASIEFFTWLVATTGLYWLSPQILRRYILILSAIAVLIAADPRSLLALASMTTAVCLATRVSGASERVALLGAIAAIVIVLFTFKLLDAGGPSSTLVDRFVPLGLSYYSLRCIHLLMERYLDNVSRPEIMQVVEYLFFPATIVAGPIHRYPGFCPDKAAAFEYEKFSAGLERILYGYAKIAVLSNYLLSNKLIPWATSGLAPSSATYQYIDTLGYGLTLYLQFSGYSDVAIGFALLLGHRVIENFSWPFLRTNIAEFWRNWHISLTRLCREYVFTGVFAGTRQAWIGVVATMLAISLWHGVTLNYLAWGLYHASGLLVFRIWSGTAMSKRMRDAIPTAVAGLIGWFITFQFVMLGFVWTKESTLGASLDVCLVLVRGVLQSV